MRILSRALTVCALIAAFGAAMAQNRPPRNSYIERRVYSVSDLVGHVRSDRAVMDRYRRHFAMSDEEVIAYLSSLRVIKLKKDAVFTVYGVPRSNGVIHSNLRLLKVGEPVLVEADGTPVLMLVCGNPLILGPRKPTIGNPIVATESSPEPARQVEVDAPPVPTPNDTAASVPPVGDLPPADYQPPGKSSVSPLPLLLGLAGGIGIFVGGSNPPPVPEPMTMLVMAGGLAAMAARRRTKNNKS